MLPAASRPIETLLERLRAALVAVANAGSLEHRRARVAMEHLEFEIAPLLEAIDLEAIVIEIRTAAATSAVAEYKRKQALPPRTALPMSTDRNMPPGHPFAVTSRPQMPAFLPDRLFIASPELWIIHDITIGNHSQTAQAGSLPGVAFSDPDLSLRFETAQTAMDVVLYAEYIGDRPEGEVFRAAFMGIAVGYENYPSTWGPPVGARRMGDPHRAIGPSPIGGLRLSTEDQNSSEDPEL